MKTKPCIDAISPSANPPVRRWRRIIRTIGSLGVFTWSARYLAVCLAGVLIVAGAAEGQELDDERVVMIPWVKAPKEVPVFYSVEARVEARIGLDQASGTHRLVFRVHQGEAKLLSVELVGTGEVEKVVGNLVKDWSVRVAADGRRYLDIRPKSGPDGKMGTMFKAMVQVKADKFGDELAVLLPGPGESSGFALRCDVLAEKGAGLRVLEVDGLLPIEDTEHGYIGSGTARLRFKVVSDGVWAKGIEMTGCELSGRLSGDGKSVAFTVSGRARAESAGSSIELLDGKVALDGTVAGDGWRIALRERRKGEWVHDLVATRAGEFLFRVKLDAPVGVNGDWRSVKFKVPGGVVVPVRLAGYAGEVEFKPTSSVVPRPRGGSLLGFLPPTGWLSMDWRDRDAVEDGSLFFSSTETSDVRVGSGLLRQRTLVDLKVLQGQLGELAFALDGDGEVLGVEGDTVVAWSVKVVAGKRQLHVALSRPIEKSDRITIESQVPMLGTPLEASAIRLSPVGTLRHSGWLRVSNEGSVRIDVLNTSGLIQLAPHQYPGKQLEDVRQSLVYRFPSADYGYEVRATQVLPEVALSEVTVYELGETDLRILSDIELDIHEAPLREWELMFPADHAVSSVAGAAVADYAVGSEVTDGMRTLRVLFNGPVAGRQLVRVVMSKNQSPKVGAWSLQPLAFGEVKSHRGYIGVVAAAGFRVGVGEDSGLAEVPLSFFPKKFSGLQQAFRLRDPEWSADLLVEALGQSIQADVFHLYSLKSGAVYGSVLVNYFVVGAPASEWRIEVPEAIGNIDVTGQFVGRDWRRSGNTVIVPLSRPILGTGTVLLTFEQPMNSRGGEIRPGAVRPLEVQGERGVIQVVSPLQVNHQSTSNGSLLQIDASEIPTEFRLLSSAPTLGAWQYTARDFDIAMDVEWFEPGETLDQVVDFQRLGTKVSRDGQWVTESRIFVKTRGQGLLRARLPDEAVLLEAKVGGLAVNARADGDHTLVPLPSGEDPNESVEVFLMYGAKSDSERYPLIVAPVFDVPVVIGEWLVTGDDGRRLLPSGGTANLIHPVQAENGWQWLARNRGPAWLMLVLGLGAMALGRWGKGRLPTVIAAMVAGLFCLCALVTAMSAARTSHMGGGQLEYAAPVVGANEAITVEVANLPEWQAATSTGMWALMVLGLAACVWGAVQRDRRVIGVGLVALPASLLSIHGGAAVFFVAMAAIGLVWLVPLVARCLNAWRLPRFSQTAALLALLACLAPLRSEAAPTDVLPAQSMQHELSIRDQRLLGQMEVSIHGEAGKRYLLLKQPAVLTEFRGAGIRLEKGLHGQSTAYWLVAERDGLLSGSASFEMPVADPSKAWSLPCGPAAVQQVSIRWNQGGWAFTSPEAAKVVEMQGLTKAESGAVLSMGPSEAITLQAKAKQRDIGSEETRFYAEVANLFVPGPGVVNGKHQVTIRPAQGRVTQLVMKVPDGFTVSDVVDGPVGKWRFDPQSMELRVQVEPAQIGRFKYTVETQRSAGDLPVDLSVVPLRVMDSAGEVGLIGLAFGDEVQPEGVKAEGLSKVNPEDFDGQLLMDGPKRRPMPVVLQHAFRYSAEEASVQFRVNAVAPELRSNVWQLVSLGEDRLVVTADLEVSITRAGVFQLELEVPEWLEVESATGGGLSHWTQDGAGASRKVVLHLNGKSIGVRQFSLTLVGAAVDEAEGWQVPKLRLLKASRETGMLTIVPERGLRVRALTRQNVVQVDPRELAAAKNALSRAAVKPEALSYRLLQGDWQLGLSIRKLAPWVTATVFHDTTIREGQVLTKLDVAYRIDNASVKSQRLRIPGLDEKSAATLRATGAAVADLVAVDGEQGVWEIRFQRGIAGNTRVALEYQRLSKEGGEESLDPIELVGVRQTNYVVAVRAGGRLELETVSLPRGWARADWSSVQGLLGQAGGGEIPNQVFRVADPEGSLVMRMKRHELADLRKLRVAEGRLTTLMSSEGGNLLTSVWMRVKVVDKSTMRVTLPEGAELYNVFVNNEGAPLVREGGDWLFYVFPSPDPDKDSEVRFVYSSTKKRGKTLEGPVLDVPMENLTWQVLVPEGWRMAGYDGDFDLKGQQQLGSFRLEDYQSFIQSKSRQDTQMAVGQIEQAQQWLEAGDQQKASLAFSNALNNGQLDEASSEDARVRLRLLKEQQAVLGLNSRRQKLMLDNRNAAQQQEVLNPQAERATQNNTVLQGRYNYDPKQYDRFLEGNSADETAALKAIANRIVAQQLAAEPAPAALDVTIPERGQMFQFGRSVQVGSKQPMAMDIRIERMDAGFSWTAVLLCLMLGGMVAVRRKG